MTIDTAIERYLAGQSLTAASEGICSPTWLWKQLLARGIPRRKQGYPADMGRTAEKHSAALDNAVARYEKGDSLANACKGLCCVETLRQELKRRGIDRRHPDQRMSLPGARIRERIRQGWSLEAIADEVGCHPNTLYNHGYRTKSTAAPSEHKREAVSMYKVGHTTTEIADHLGYSYETIRTWLIDAGVKLRRKGTRSKWGKR